MADAPTWDKSAIWDKENDVPERFITYVDDNVIAKLPAGTRVEGIFPHGASYWTRTAEIHTQQTDGTTVSYFLKVTQNEGGKGMLSGEFASMSALHDAMPELAPKPYGWGTYASDPDTHFFVCAFHEMTDDIPNVQTFPAKIAELHMKTVSPNGKYGFHVQTYQGRIPQVITYTESWEEYFQNMMKAIFSVEEDAQGPDEEMKQDVELLFNKVIPRLLRPLETGGRSIQPRLVHGDLWDGNASTDVATDLPVIFDAASHYCHNEYELAPWKPVRHKMTKPYVRAYHKHFPISAPEEDHEDRLTLYEIRFNTLSSSLYPGNLRFRDVVKESLRSLVEKYPEGYEGWAEEKGEGPFPRKDEKSSEH